MPEQPTIALSSRASNGYPRLAEDGTTKTDVEMKGARLKGLHRIMVRGDDGEYSEAVLELKYRRMLVLPPGAKQKDYGPLELTVIHAFERGTLKGRKRITWKLLTDVPVRSAAEAIEKLNWHALRWKIELFDKILKSGCRVEQSRLRTAPRLVNLIVTCCVVAWRIFWLTMLNRSEPTSRTSAGTNAARASTPRSAHARQRPFTPARHTVAVHREDHPHRRLSCPGS